MLESFFETPVRAEPPISTWARLVQQQRTRAHARDPVTRACNAVEPIDQHGIRNLGPRADASRDEDDVEFGMVLERMVREHTKSLGAPHWTVVFGDGDDRVGGVAAVDTQHR